MTFTPSPDTVVYVVAPANVTSVPRVSNDIAGGALAVGGGGNSPYICVNSNQEVQYGFEANGVIAWGAPISVGSAYPGVKIYNEFWLAKVISNLPVVVRVYKTRVYNDPTYIQPPYPTQRIVVTVYKTTDWVGAPFTSQTVYDQTIKFACTAAERITSGTIATCEAAIAASQAGAGATFNGTFDGFVVSPSTNAPKLVAFDKNGVLLTNMVNGTDYTIVKPTFLAAGLQITSVCHHSGYFWATVSNGNKAYKISNTSTTPLTWTAVTLPESGPWTGIAGNQDTRLYASLDNVFHAYTSTNNGTTWTKELYTESFYAMRGVSYIDETTAAGGYQGRFVIIGSEDQNKLYETCALTLEYA